MLLLDITFMKRGGRWYLNRWNVSTEEDEIESALGVQL
mgnify:FL=1